ncbi:MAG: hypothetical protein MRERV_45c005 [Mycoplasmataceae bacterium RV_VA103A]|nr:MAG: hypothetical protein MRERV_45c005 [Mycoplasmataceae bacterium RV_VA103A]
MNKGVLADKIHLCYIDTEDLREWIKENRLLDKDFSEKKEKWDQEINQRPNFFSDTELLLAYQDALLLKVLTESQAIFLAKTYQLEYQNVCQKLFQEPKNIFLVGDRQWKIINDSILFEGEKQFQNTKKIMVLLKDRKIIAEKLSALLLS